MPRTPSDVMVAMSVGAGGPPDALRLEDRPIPRPTAGEVLIRVVGAGVNGHDLHHRAEGKHPLLPGETNLPGLEVSGEVMALGPGVKTLRPGDMVCALLRGGGYATYAVAPAAVCLPIPAGCSIEEAGGLPETYFTVWSNLFRSGGLDAGMNVLVQGGTSGVGVTAIQLARAFGARVFATAGSEAKCASCLALGADVAINHRSEAFEDVVMAATEGRGVDLILDIVAGSYLPREIACLALDGRLIVLGAAEGSQVSFDLAPLVRKRGLITGATLRPRPLAYKAQIARALRTKVWPLFETGEIRPVTDAVFPLSQASAAHHRMEERQHVGKVVLSPDAATPVINPPPR